MLGEFGNLIAGDPRSRCVRHTLVTCYMSMFTWIVSMNCIAVYVLFLFLIPVL